MPFDQIILLFLQKVIIGLKIQQSQKGIRATGRSAESLKTAFDGQTGKAMIVGNEAIFFQIHGRAPGRRPAIHHITEEWFFRKNIPLIGITVESFLFLVRRKIGREGTDIFQGKRPALSIEEEVEKQIEELKTDLAANERAAMAEVLRSAVLTSFG